MEKRSSSSLLLCVRQDSKAKVSNTQTIEEVWNSAEYEQLRAHREEQSIQYLL